MVHIENTVSYKSLNEIASPEERLVTAEQAGAGLALFGALSSGIDFSTLPPPLPGYRNTRCYYDQLLSILAGHRTLEEAEAILPIDPVVRQATEQHFLVHLPIDEHRRRIDDPEVRPFLALLRENEGRALLLSNGAGGGAPSALRHPWGYQARELPLRCDKPARAGAGRPRHDHGAHLALRLGRHGAIVLQRRG